MIRKKERTVSFRYYPPGRSRIKGKEKKVSSHVAPQKTRRIVSLALVDGTLGGSYWGPRIRELCDEMQDMLSKLFHFFKSCFHF